MIMADNRHGSGADSAMRSDQRHGIKLKMPRWIRRDISGGQDRLDPFAMPQQQTAYFGRAPRSKRHQIVEQCS